MQSVTLLSRFCSSSSKKAVILAWSLPTLVSSGEAVIPNICGRSCFCNLS